MEILVLFDSKGGYTYKLGQAVAEGILSVGEQARIRQVPETTPVEVIRANEEWSKFYDWKEANVPKAQLSDLTECDGFAVGSPTRYGNMTPSMGNFIESTGPLWVSGALVNKPVGFFMSSTTMHGGQETTLISMMFPFMHHGCLIVPMGYTNPGIGATDRGGTPYGPSYVSGGTEHPSETEAEIARAFGRRLVEITRKMA
ncbi:MAG: NAD(P)H:quinone oxidoreductase [Armatimonadota bacterium]